MKVILLYLRKIKDINPNKDYSDKISFEGRERKDKVVPLTSETVTPTKRSESVQIHNSSLSTRPRRPVRAHQRKTVIT